MAEFRKLFYALGLAALISSTASAQTTCTRDTGSNLPIVREESFADLVGDYVLRCTSAAGTSTAAGQFVPEVTVTVSLSVNITSKILAGSGALGNWSEALLIVDEPNTPGANTNVPLLACGDGGAPANLAGNCRIIATANPSNTYDGATAIQNVTACTDTDSVTTGNQFAYTCGRPNVFQGRQGVGQANNNNIIVFQIPFDPPGVASGGEGGVSTPRTRTLRITNIRANVPPATASGLFQSIIMQVNINGSTSVTINNPSATVASVARGLQAVSLNAGATLPTSLPLVSPAVTGPSFNLGLPGMMTFLQCNSIGVLFAPQTAGLGTVRFREGFTSSFKTRGYEQLTSNSTGTNTYLYNYTSSSVFSAVNSTTPLKQNIPGANYNTESGFVSPSNYGVPSAAQLVGTSEPTGQGASFIANNSGIANAGIATQGTRLIASFKDIPTGVTLNFPAYINLVQAGTGAAALTSYTSTSTVTSVVTGTVTGVAIRVNPASIRGDGPSQATAVGLTLPTGSVTTTPGVAITESVVYEILYSDHRVLEDLIVPVAISFSSNAASNLPTPDVIAQVSGGFAPFQATSLFDSATTWGTAQSASPTVQLIGFSWFLPVPRFRNTGTFANFLVIAKCNCNLLFPFVTNQQGWDTGVAIANTSLTPGSLPSAALRAGFSNSAQPQDGAVQFWYYPTRTTDPPVPTQCTNVATPGDCTGAKTVVKAGETLTFSLAFGNSAWGIKPTPGFQGYMIAQAGFQYCHAFAFMGPQGAPVTTNGQSVGYLGLQLDNNDTLGSRTSVPAESLDH